MSTKTALGPVSSKLIKFLEVKSKAPIAEAREATYGEALSPRMLASHRDAFNKLTSRLRDRGYAVHCRKGWVTLSEDRC